MRADFRQGVYVGLSAALLIGIFLLWLWQPERQVRKHSEHFLRQCEKRNWSRAGEFVAASYRDRWGDDRARLLSRARDVLRYFFTLEITAIDPQVRDSDDEQIWSARLTIDGQGAEVASMVKDRVNTLTTPFELHWRHASGKPWDWQLVAIDNSGLEVPVEAAE